MAVLFFEIFGSDLSKMDQMRGGSVERGECEEGEV